MSKPKIAVLYSGHQFDYLYGLITAFNDLEKYDFEIIDSNRKEGENYPELNDNIRVYKFISKKKLSPLRSVLNIIVYYLKLFGYILKSNADIYHIEWLNFKSARFEEIMIPILIKLKGKKILYKVHDISTDTLFSKKDESFELKIPKTKKYFYSKISRFIVHNDYTNTILRDYGIEENDLAIIPHGINNAIQVTSVNRSDSRTTLGIAENDKCLLFFGNIAPYKNLENLINAVRKVNESGLSVKLIIAGKFRTGQAAYESKILSLIEENSVHIIQRISHIASDDVEFYFKASDALVLPYRFIFQSGVNYLAMRFNLPTIVRDVGGLAYDIKNEKTGYIYSRDDELSSTINTFFTSQLYTNNDYAVENFEKVKEEYSWASIGRMLDKQYSTLLD